VPTAGFITDTNTKRPEGRVASEGFVNTFDVEVDGQTIWFHHRLSESAGGMRARMQLRFLSEDEYGMVLDLAAPGKEFAACQEMRLKRVR
jgi:hypothetical protein